MTSICLKTQIDTPILRVFDLAWSIEAQVPIAAGPGERAVAG